MGFNGKTILWGFILLKFVIQYFAIDRVYELHRDEFLHLDQGKHLTWGYISVPPVTSWISWVIYHLGNSVFWVKFFPALFGALTIAVVWKTVKLLNGGIYAQVLSAVCIIFSVLIRVNTLYQPNSLEYLIWTLVFYSVIRYLQQDDHRWMWLTAVLLAFGFLNKYNTFFLMTGMLVALLLTPQRRIFLNRNLYAALLLALILVLPNLLWQFKNDFPVFHHLNQLAERQLVNVNRFDFLRSQLFFFGGSLAIIVSAFFSFFLHSPFRKYRFVFWCFLITISIFFFLKAKDYYTIGLYPVLIVFGCVYMEHVLKKGWLIYLKPLLILSPIITIIAVYQLILPVLPPEKIKEKTGEFQRLGLLRWEDGVDHQLPQDFADMLGWKELAGIVDSTMNLVSDKENTLIHCDNYGQAGAINFYSKGLVHDAVSLNADYINWYPLDEINIRNVILVQESDDDDPERIREKRLFDTVSLMGRIENQYAREYGTSVYLLQGAKQSINEILREEIEDRKSP